MKGVMENRVPAPELQELMPQYPQESQPESNVHCPRFGGPEKFSEEMLCGN